MRKDIIKKGLIGKPRPGFWTWVAWIVCLAMGFAAGVLLSGCGAAQDLLQKPAAKAGGDVDQETTQEAEQTEDSARGGDVQTEEGDVKVRQKTEKYESDPTARAMWVCIGSALALILLLADRPGMGVKTKTGVLIAALALIMAPLLYLILSAI